jgi:hypothetical protein
MAFSEPAKGAGPPLPAGDASRSAHGDRWVQPASEEGSIVVTGRPPVDAPASAVSGTAREVSDERSEVVAPAARAAESASRAASPRAPRASALPLEDGAENARAVAAARPFLVTEPPPDHLNAAPRRLAPLEAHAPQDPRPRDVHRRQTAGAAVVTPSTLEPHAKAAEAPTRSAPSPSPPATPLADLPDLIVQTISLRWQEGGGEARLRLRPEFLGELTVRVAVDNGVVIARLEADSPAVREWIERHEISLRQALGELGLTLEELVVSDREGAEDRSGRRRDESEADPRRSPAPRHRRTRPGEDEPRFEVTA